MQSDISNAHKWSAADAVTILRMVGTLGLALLNPGTLWFFAVYTITGFSDVLDGWLARKTGTESDFGAKLDSIADLLFYTVMLIRLCPVMWEKLPMQVWYAAAGILFVRSAAYFIAAIKYCRFAVLHTRLNKLTGGAIFLLPYILAISTGVVYSWTVCALASAASLEELAIHLRQKCYCTDVKGILQLARKSKMLRF